MNKQHPNKEYIDAYVMGDQLQYSWDNGHWFDFPEEYDEDHMDYCGYLLSWESPLCHRIRWRIQKKPRVSWMNIYDGRTPTAHATREEADEFHRNHYSTDKRFACIKVTEGEGL